DCSESEFECHDGTCIPLDQKCDRVFDCFDDSDEADCPIVTCGTDEWTCNSLHCIPMAAFCNGVRDCYDDSDEPNNVDCRYPLQQCSDEEFRCYDGQCIKRSKRCYKLSSQTACSKGEHLTNCDD
uniref:G-protein coupled receptor GRL101-like n=1 Tax=Saccoglossus kowalevskii TaxID=10224 RepID=A0ABM0N1J1_SACKO